MDVIVNASYTEIYAGGGKFLTQSAPTNFHGRWTQKILVGDETPEDFVEVTAKEMEALEKSDAKWEKPPLWFIVLWNAACGKYGCYNEQTGYFELNGFTDITYKEAVEIYNAGRVTALGCAGLYTHKSIRTNLPPLLWGANSGLSRESHSFDVDSLVTHSTIEVLNLDCGDNMTIKQPYHNFISLGSASRLVKVIGSIGIQNVDVTPSVIRSHTLRNIHLAFLFKDCDLSAIPLLDHDSVEFLIKNKYPNHPSAPIVTVHSNVYACLTGDDTNDAYNSLTAEEKEQWASLVDKAAEKQITFATK